MHAARDELEGELWARASTLVGGDGRWLLGRVWVTVGLAVVVTVLTGKTPDSAVMTMRAGM
jgi:hypothetical protein